MSVAVDIFWCDLDAETESGDYPVTLLSGDERARAAAAFYHAVVVPGSAWQLNLQGDIAAGSGARA
jgi:hypothetical protein